MTKRKRIPEKEWVWQGYPGHFLLADSCKFRLNTVVGDTLISTVGDYRNPRTQKQENLGSNDGFFETFVFRPVHSCRCSIPDCNLLVPDSFMEVWGRRTANYIEASKMHMEVCDKVAKGELDEA